MSHTLANSMAVLGAGSWGTALALLLARNKVPTRLWGKDSKQLAAMKQQRVNDAYLPGITFPNALTAHVELNEALADVDDLLIAVPSHAFRDVLQQIKPSITEKTRIVWASKGLDPKQGDLLNEVAKQELGVDIPLAIIAGPSFAKEVAKGLPTAITVCTDNLQWETDLAARFHNETFRVYTNHDMIGVEVGGAVKNVLAIAVGISDGLGFGANARAALITRGLAEMVHLGKALGAQVQTFMGLTGMGDLVLTCTDNQSRNRRFGLAIGQGQTQAQAVEQIGQVVEGISNTTQVHQLAQRLHVEMPITAHVYKILNAEMTPLQAAQSLLARDTVAEIVL